MTWFFTNQIVQIMAAEWTWQNILYGEYGSLRTYLPGDIDDWLKSSGTQSTLRNGDSDISHITFNLQWFMQHAVSIVLLLIHPSSVKRIRSELKEWETKYSMFDFGWYSTVNKLLRPILRLGTYFCSCQWLVVCMGKSSEWCTVPGPYSKTRECQVAAAPRPWPTLMIQWEPGLVLTNKKLTVVHQHVYVYPFVTVLSFYLVFADFDIFPHSTHSVLYKRRGGDSRLRNIDLLDKNSV